VQISPVGIANWNPQVSPDGQKVCVKQFYIDQFGIVGSQLYLMNLDGSNRQALIDGEQGVWVDRSRFSSDGSKIFFTINRPEIHWIDLNSGVRNIVRLAVTEECLNPCPDTSGNRIYLRCGDGADPNEDSEIIVVDIDGNDFGQLTNNRFRDDIPIVGVVKFLE